MICKKCDISVKNSFKPCWRDGNKNDILVIGEAPGTIENKTKVPFTGKSGKVIREFLKNYGLLKFSSITNVIKCQPERNRDPLPYEIANCRDYLIEDVLTVNPKLIILAGKIPTEVFTNKQIDIVAPYIDIPFVIAGNIIVVPIYHPSYIIRNDLESKYFESFNKLSILYNKINPYYSVRKFVKRTDKK